MELFTSLGYIYICNPFYSLSPNGLDSAGGTLVHEASHFATTDDFRYGVNLATQLAIDYPNLAVINADNAQFYSEWVSGER
jgi:peptidyl-Lys metalloendopeptidase